MSSRGLMGEVIATFPMWKEIVESCTVTIGEIAESMRGQPVYYILSSGERYCCFSDEYIYRQYAALINNGRPCKVSWRRLNTEQRERAVELASVYGW